MGNRSSLDLTHTPDQRDYQVLEANNQLPFFWVLLLDQSTIIDNDDLFPAEPDDDSPCRSLPVSRETLLGSRERSVRYLSRFYPELTAEFTIFADYIIGLTDKGIIEVDLLEITNFSSPREFRDDTLALLQRLDSLEPLSDRDRNEYISHDPTYLIGVDDFATITPRYSEISDSYSAASASDPAPATPADTPGWSPTQTSSSQLRPLSPGRILAVILPLVIGGELVLFASLWALIFDDDIPRWLSAIGVVLGLALLIRALVLYRRRDSWPIRSQIQRVMR